MANFSTDPDITKWEPDILRYLPETQLVYTLQHTAAHDFILQDLIQDRIIKTEAQILVPAELTILSVFKTLEIIMNFLSANLNDRWDIKSQQYGKRYSQEFEDIKKSLTVDANDNAVLDPEEENPDHTPVMERW